MIALLLAAGLAQAAPAGKVVEIYKQVSADRVLSIRETEAGLELTVEGKKKAVVRAPSKARCFKFFYGAGLAQCARSCDDTEHRMAVRVSRDETAPATAWEIVDRLRLEGGLSHLMSNPDGLRLVRKNKVRARELPNGKTRVLKVLRTEFALSSDGSAADNDACRVPVSDAGDACLTAVSEKLPANRFLVEGSGYEAALRAASLDAMADDAAMLRSKLAAAGLASFERAGHFYAVNARNAPSVFCQDANSESVRNALRENADELRRSIDFLTRYRADAPTGGLPEAEESL